MSVVVESETKAAILCACCKEAPARVIDQEIGPVCEECLARLDHVDAQLAHLPFLGGCRDPRNGGAA